MDTKNIIKQTSKHNIFIHYPLFDNFKHIYHQWLIHFLWKEFFISTKWSYKCAEDWYFFLVLYWLWCQQLCVVLWLVAAVCIHQGLSAGQAENQYWSRPPKLVLVVWVPAHIFSKVCLLFSSTRWCLTYSPACSRCTISGPCVEHTATDYYQRIVTKSLCC